jgi:Lhr-like helicase
MQADQGDGRGQPRRHDARDVGSRCRNHKSDKSRFLYDVGTVVFDESHLLTVPNRGDHIEVALMKLAEINPDIRVVLLSATMPNVDEICGWTSKTDGPRHLLPGVGLPALPAQRPLRDVLRRRQGVLGEGTGQKVGTACAIVEYYPDDKFLIFVHTIETGLTMVKALARYGVKAEFHNSTWAWPSG